MVLLCELMRVSEKQPDQKNSIVSGLVLHWISFQGTSDEIKSFIHMIPSLGPQYTPFPVNTDGIIFFKARHHQCFIKLAQQESSKKSKID